MELFIWAVAIGCTLDILVIVSMLANGKIQQRTPKSLGFSALVGMAWVVWAAVLLA